MKGFLKQVAAILIINFVFLFSIQAGANWKLVINKNGIKVYTRPVVGSDLDEFKGITVVNASIDVIGEVLKDVPAQPEWMGDCIVARVVKRLAGDDVIVYNVTNAPWPVSDRDVIVKSKTVLEYKSGRVIIYMKAVKIPLVPIRKDRIRMTELTGNWILHYISRNKTSVLYQVRTNPAGSIPAVIANLTSKNIPFKTLTGMKKIVKKKKYIDRAAKAKGVTEIERFLKKGE